MKLTAFPITLISHTGKRYDLYIKAASVSMAQDIARMYVQNNPTNKAEA